MYNYDYMIYDTDILDRQRGEREEGRQRFTRKRCKINLRTLENINYLKQLKFR